MHPKQRSNGLLVEELLDETVVYDKARFRAHCLNRVAAHVWKQCNGRTSVAMLARRLRDDLGVAADETMVRLIVEQLEESHLLSGGAARTKRRSRRDVARQLAVLGLAGAVMTIPVPSALAAGSVGLGGACKTATDCAAGLCCCLDNSGGNHNVCIDPAMTTCSGNLRCG
jgi:hypothetical protein